MRENKYDATTDKGTLIKFDRNGKILSAKKSKSFYSYMLDVFLLKDSALMVPVGQNGKLLLNKMDEDFNIIWTRSYDPGGKLFSIKKMVQAADSSFYVLLEYDNPYPPYIALLKFSKNGDFQWQKNYIANLTFAGFHNTHFVELNGSIYLSTTTYAGDHFPTTVIFKVDGKNGNIIWINYYNNPEVQFESDYSLFTVNNRIGLSQSASEGPPSYRNYPAVTLINEDGKVEKTKIFKSDLYSFSPFVTVVKTRNGDLVFQFIATDFTVDPFISSFSLLRIDSSLNILTASIFKGHYFNSVSPLKEGSDGGFYGILSNFYDDPYESDITFRKFTHDLKAGSCGSEFLLMKDSLIEVQAIPDKFKYAPDLKIVEVKESLSFEPYDLSFREANCEPEIICDEIKLAGRQLICSTKDTVTYAVQRNAGCTTPASFNVDPAFGKIVASNDSTVKVLFTKSGTTKVFAHINSGCKVILDSISITIKLSPEQISLGADLEICGPQAHTLDAGEGFKSYLWQDGSDQQKLTVTSNGKYFVSATNFCGKIFSDTITIFSGIPDPIYAGADTFKCNSDHVTLSAIEGFPSYQWMADGKIIDELSNKITLAPTRTTKYYVRGEKKPGCTSLDSMTITVFQTPAIQLGMDTSICAGTELQLDPGPGFADYVWSTGATTRNITINKIGNYFVKAFDLNGCYSTDTIQLLQVFSLPKVSLDKTPLICEGTGKELDAGSGFLSYLWSNGSRLPSIRVSSKGKFWVRVTDEHGCEGTDTTEIKTISSLPIHFLPKDTAICSYETITLQSKGSYKEYRWSTGDFSNQIEIKNPGTYILQVTDLNGCEGTDQIKISSKPCAEGIYFPNAFTPNKDFKNDAFKPIVFGKIMQFEFMVFNRFGKQIFNSNDPSKGWDGTIKGEPQPVGSFVWICNYQFFDKPAKSEKGVVTMIR